MALQIGSLNFSLIGIVFGAAITEATPLFAQPAKHQPESASNELRADAANGLSEYSVYRIKVKSLRTLGENGGDVNYELNNALVQEYANVAGAGSLCAPVFVSTKPPCESTEKLVSFVRHSNSTNQMPKRGECFCVPKSLTNGQSMETHLSAIALPRGEDLNVIDQHHRAFAKLSSASGTTPLWNSSSLYLIDRAAKPPVALRFLNDDKKIVSLSEVEDPYRFEVDQNTHGESYRVRAAQQWNDSQSSLEWNDSTTKKPRDPYAIGVKDYEFQKEAVLSQYTQRSVDALGTDHSAFATFHNAWKLARVTRDNNGITLDKINSETRKELFKRFGDEKIVKRLMPKYTALNEYLWLKVHAEAQKNKPSDPSAAVDEQFKLAINGKGHAELWNRFADVEATISDIEHEQANPLNSVSTIASAREIISLSIKDGATPPAPEMCRRQVISEHPNVCPCRPRYEMVPCNLELSSLTKDNFQKSSQDYGRTSTYQLVDEGTLPVGLRSQTISSKRTGYSRPNNSPSGSSVAGFAALNRSGGDGIAHLGRGSLNDPITAAVSRGAAVKYGICQGDMIHDPNYGWLRVEGGCTSDFDDVRIDVWQGGAATSELQTTSFDPKNSWQFKHFPGGLVDIEYARKFPGKIR